MTVKELKKFLDNIDENCEVFIEVQVNDLFTDTIYTADRQADACFFDFIHNVFVIGNKSEEV